MTQVEHDTLSMQILEKEIFIEERYASKQTLKLNLKKIDLEQRKLTKRVEETGKSIEEIDKQIEEAKADLKSMKEVYAEPVSNPQKDKS